MPESESDQSQSGRLITGPDLRELLRIPDKVFREGTWAEENLTSSGYYARLAGSPLVLPPQHGESVEYISIGEDENPISDFRLKPGETAVISTVECFSIDLDVTVHIGQQFRWAARGILMLHGSTAHPGYGRSAKYGSWLPDDNVRLYFVIANVGPSELYMECGKDKIVYLQFSSVTPEPERHKGVRSDGFDYLKSRLYDERIRDASGLTFFKTVREVQDLVEQHRLAAEMAVRDERDRREEEHRDAVESLRLLEAKLTGQMKGLDERATSAKNLADRATNASNYVVVFGVFLVTAAILGVALDSLAGALESLQDPADYRTWVVLALALAYAVTTIVAVVKVAEAIKLPRDERSSAAREVEAGERSTSKGPAN